MSRLTVRENGVYTAVDPDAAIQKLGRLEDMQQALQAEYDRTVTELARLSAAGKTKTVTYRQLFANKLNLMNLLDRFALYGE